MAFINPQGLSISFECSELIAELKQDIAEFGKNLVVNVWCKDEQGVTLYVNYDFTDNENPITPDEIREGEYIVQMQADELLELLVKQNEII